MMLSLLAFLGFLIKVNGLSDAVRPSTPNRVRGLRPMAGNDVDLRELSAEERQKEWAARIIEDHEKRKKENSQKQPRRGPQRVSIVPSGGPVVVESDASRIVDGESNKEVESPSDWYSTLLDVFDGQLGPMRLALRASSEGMLSVIARLKASPAAEEGVIVLRAQGVECLVDTRRCAGIEFTTRSENDKYVQFAITVKRKDQESFLSALLGEDDSQPIPPDVAKRWQELRENYGTTFF